MAALWIDDQRPRSLVDGDGDAESCHGETAFNSWMNRFWDFVQCKGGIVEWVIRVSTGLDRRMDVFDRTVEISAANARNCSSKISVESPIVIAMLACRKATIVQMLGLPLLELSAYVLVTCRNMAFQRTLKLQVSCLTAFFFVLSF